MEIVSISDLHIGHNKIPPEIIHRNLNKFLYPQLNDDLDLLILGGDFWHTLLNLTSIYAFYATMIIAEILDLSIKHNFLVRVLDGTNEHDRDQNKYFRVTPNKYPNVKTVEHMGIEYIEKYDIYILYIPDDLPYKNAQSEAISRIKEMNLQKVDIISLHGFCKHEIPKNTPIEPFNIFDVDILSEYVKGPILKGHIHTKGIYKCCIGNGSFERDRHGREEKKGFFRINYDKKIFSYKFIENTDTLIFKTIVLPKENFVPTFISEMEKLISKVDELTPLPLYVRLSCNKEVKSKFNPYDFDFKISIRYTFDLLDTPIQNTENYNNSYKLTMTNLPIITRESLSILLSETLDNKLNPSEIEEILREVKNET